MRTRWGKLHSWDMGETSEKAFLEWRPWKIFMYRSAHSASFNSVNFFPYVILFKLSYLQGFPWTWGKKWNPERSLRIAPEIPPQQTCSEMTFSAVCSNSTSTQAVTFLLFSIPKREVAQASAISNEDNHEPNISLLSLHSASENPRKAQRPKSFLLTPFISPYFWTFKE